MVYTITLNPSLDYIIEVNDFRINKVNRTFGEVIFPGGKGINVSIVLGNMGHDTVALGFTAGFTGDEIKRLLSGKDIATDFIRAQSGFSRINVKVRAGEAGRNSEEGCLEAHVEQVKQGFQDTQDNNNNQNDRGVQNIPNSHAFEETEINGMGPAISADELEMLYRKLDKLSEGDILVLAGSIPASLPKTIYADIMQRLSGRGIRIVVDATGEALTKTLQYHPFLIKPNHHELGELFGVDLIERSGGDPEALKKMVREYAGRLQELGACNVLVSMGGMGAALLAETGEYYFAQAPKGKVINTVGAGDSMVAGFLAGYLEALQAKDEEKKGGLKKADLQEDRFYRALVWGICAGSASAFSEELATLEAVEKLCHEIL